MVNLAGLDGSRRPRRHQIQANTGDRTTRENGATDCSQLGGKAKPNASVRVARWANRLSVEPACSKTDQKIVAATKSTRTTTRRFRSSDVQFPARNIQRKNTTVVRMSTTPRELLTPWAVMVTVPVRASSQSSAAPPKATRQPDTERSPLGRRGLG